MKNAIFKIEDYSRKFQNAYGSSLVRVGMISWYIHFIKIGQNWRAGASCMRWARERMIANITITLIHPEDASKSVKGTIWEDTDKTTDDGIDFPEETIKAFLKEDTVTWQMDIEVLRYTLYGIGVFPFDEPLENGFEIKGNKGSFYCRRELLAFHVPFIADLISSGVYSYKFRPGRFGDRTLFHLLQLLHGVHLDRNVFYITRYGMHKQLVFENDELGYRSFKREAPFPVRALEVKPDYYMGKPYYLENLDKEAIQRLVKARMILVEMSGEEMKLWAKEMFSLEESKQKNLSSDDC